MPTPTLRESVRDDGLRVITKSLPCTKRVLAAVIARGGSVHDPPRLAGLMHFFEHMAFKGTCQRTQREITEFTIRYCCDGFNAETRLLETVYYGGSTYLYTNELVEILLDVYQNATFPEKEIVKEREVVLNERAGFADSPLIQSHQALCRLLWRKNPLREFILPCLGSRETLNRITRETLIEARRKWYAPSNTVVVATGNVRHDTIARMVFAQVPNDDGRVTHGTWDEEWADSLSRRNTTITIPNLQGYEILIGCKMPPPTERSRMTLAILLSMLASEGDSLLWDELREKRGWIYNINASHNSEYRLGHHLYIDIGMLPNRLTDVRALTMNVLLRHPLNHAHFKRIREAIANRCLIDLESADVWQDVIIARIINEGRSVADLIDYEKRRQTILSSISFGEVIKLRTVLFQENRLACVTTKS